ncbi:MAG: GerMN domain-containing protein [Candidatus Obscuribacterales bacterium]|nr:GerMN domain-containing protein [Candidatus Obscuribacterales bacterium]
MVVKPGAIRLVQLAVGVFACSAVLLTGCAERKILTGSADPQQMHAEPTVQAELVGNTAEVWFVKPGSETLDLVKVSRKLSGKDKLEAALIELLHGPTGEEEAQGLATEIPKGTILLGVRAIDDDYEIDLSRRFAASGGGASMETRMEQLKRTVVSVVGEHKVFLNVEGKRLVASSDGLEIQQPINY